MSLNPLRWRYGLLLTGLFWLICGARGAATADVSYVPGSSQKLEQLIGDTDLQTGLPTPSQTQTQHNLANTDLGVPFYHRGKTYMLFGDSDFPGTADSMGFTTNADPESGLALSFYHPNNSSNYTPIQIPVFTGSTNHISSGAYDVPIFGLSSSNKLYLYYETGANSHGGTGGGTYPGDTTGPTMGYTVVSVSSDDGATFSAPLYTLSSNKLVNVSVVRVNCADWPGLPMTNGLGLLIYGAGSYRRSDIYLAFQPESDLATGNAISYYSGPDTNGSPTWSSLDSDATNFIKVHITAMANTNGSGVGEMSATFNVFLKKWLVFYNLSGQIQFREADLPWGPFSAKGTNYDPVIDNGFNHYIYLPGGTNNTLCDPNVTGHNLTTAGGVYGPYIFSQFSAGSASETNISTTLYHSLSTWNPYNSMLMRTKLTRRVPPVLYAGSRTTNSLTTAMLGGADAWVQSGTNADLNFGTNSFLWIKNDGPSLGDVTRKAWLKFPLSLAATQRVTSASLNLTINSPGISGVPFTYQVYGLRFASTNQNWTDTNITWNNAPGNNGSDGLEMDWSQAVFLGAFSTPSNRVAGQPVSCSSVLLKDFLNQSGGGPVTLMISRLSINSLTENFASGKNTSNPPPTLTYVAVPKIPDQSLTRNFGTGPIPFNVDSTATAATNLAVTVVCNNTNLIPLANIVTNGTGTNRTVTITPATNQTGTALVTLTVSDGVATPDSNSFWVNVTPNHAPVLAALSNLVVAAGTELDLTNSATDPDLPAQTLAFSLLTAPTNATLNASNGVLKWRPTMSQVNSTNTISLMVADNGSPSLSNLQSFTVQVVRPALPNLSALTSTNGRRQFHVAGVSGPDYTLQVSADLNTWTNLSVTNTPTLPFDWGFTDSSNAPRRFYRLLLGP